MISKVPAEKINIAVHPAYLKALQDRREKTGQGFGFIIETALQKMLRVKIPPGTRQKRGRKPNKKSKAK